MSGPHKYKLSYFNVRARAEITRLLFAQAGVEYEDHRLESGDWPGFKSETPFGQLPLLQVDGKHVLCQSKTIARYVAIETGLAGKTHIDRAKANMIVEVIHDDLANKLFTAAFMKDEEKKAEEIKKLQEEFVPDLYQKLEDKLKANGGEYFVGKELTWADIAVADGLGWAKSCGVEASLEKFPLLAALQERVFAQPGIAAWIEKRPASNL